MNIAEQLITIAENEQKVYDAGYEKGKAESGEDGVDWSKITDFRYFSAFSNRDFLIPQLNYENTSNGTLFSQMFFQCTKLKDVPLINTSKCTNFSQMFYDCQQLTTIPEIDTSNGTSFGQMFYNCNQLKTVPLLNLSKCTNMSLMFYNCRSLTEVRFTGTINVTGSLSVFSYSPNLTVESLVSFLNALSDNTRLSTTYTVTIGSTNLSKLTQEQKQIAYDKNIALA